MRLQTRIGPFGKNQTEIRAFSKTRPRSKKPDPDDIKPRSGRIRIKKSMNCISSKPLYFEIRLFTTTKNLRTNDTHCQIVYSCYNIKKKVDYATITDGRTELDIGVAVFLFVFPNCSLLFLLLLVKSGLWLWHFYSDRTRIFEKGRIQIRSQHSKYIFFSIFIDQSYSKVRISLYILLY